VTDPGSDSLGASFLRADLHVHTYPDSATDPTPDLDAYIDAAVASGIAILAITDHNRVDFVKAGIRASMDKPVTVIPGIEISTRDGHLLALFDPDESTELEAFATAENLRLEDIGDGALRSDRSVIDLVREIGARGGLAIPAHVDKSGSVFENLRQSELVSLLTNPALAGLEFATRDALESWFTENDTDPDRDAAWKARQGDSALSERGLARLMSSDAHTPGLVGQDRSSRTLTRLRLDDPNFAAIRNAVQNNPKARCKAEAVLPVDYPRILNASFEGGFLDGVRMEFTGNLNCLIGGRGSGKSTALLAIRAALGAKLASSEDPDDADRMPEKTIVTFLDSAGSTRTATRLRGEDPLDPDGAPVRLRMADLGQDESGELARDYTDDPSALLEFLDDFVVRHEFDEREGDLIAAMDDNGAEVTRTGLQREQMQTLETEQARLEGSLKAAEDGRVEELADWARRLADQRPLLDRVEEQLNEALRAGKVEPIADLDVMASQYGVDLSEQPVAEFLDGDDGIKAKLADFEKKRAEISAKASQDAAAAAADVLTGVAAWKARQDDYEKRLGEKRKELEDQGLKVQATAIVDMARRIRQIKATLVDLRKKQKEHLDARKDRQDLVKALHDNREQLFQARKAVLRRIVQEANSYAEDLIIHVSFRRCGIDAPWCRWLSEHFGFKEPRVSRIAQMVSPREFARKLLEDEAGLLAITDGDKAVFDQESLRQVRTWAQIFSLESMLLEDRPQIDVQRKDSNERKPFNKLSAGQQRSVLLSLLLCAERNEPLILDQPEDHLDGQYIASAVVRHLEAAKERRQVLVATHSANIVVLGDAELVVPMHVVDEHGRTHDVGAVDRPNTRDQVCALLEGGTQAYKKRGERYGFIFASDPTSP
jgi:energy-coupling factor transporter ATP-binding protein EcfA2